MRPSINAGLLALLIYFSNDDLSTALAHDPVHDVARNDVEMEAAIRRARNSLPQFWAKFHHPAPDEEAFALKVAMPYDPSSAEHVWVSKIERNNGKIHGIVDNEPKYLKNIRVRQFVEIDDSRISDWMYLRGGKIVGNFTIRPLLERIDPERAALYRAKLADPQE